MVNKKRARGEHESVGTVKAAILLYLADNGERTFTDIRNHLRNHYNIVTGKIVRVHLLNLSDEKKLGLLAKKGNGNGKADSYWIKKGFFSFKKIHNFLNVQGREAHLMKTRYFQDETASVDFLVKVKLNILRNALIQCYNSMTNDEGYESMKQNLDGFSLRDRGIVVDWMDRVRAKDESDALSSNFLWIMSELIAGNVDQINEVFRDNMLRKMPDGSMAVDERNALFFSAILVPDHYKDRIVTIIRLSPGALDYVLNSACSNPLFPSDPVLAYTMNILLPRNQNKVTMNPDMVVDLETCREYTKKLPSYSLEPPIFIIARSLFIADMIYHRLVKEDVSREQLELVFSGNIG